MPPPKKGKTQGINFEQQDILQAVIIADRFDQRFIPVTDDVPLALFPVANKPLISYTLDFLVSAGVQQIYVYCCEHASMIKEFLAKSKWNSKCSQCQITPIVSSDATSLGDVLRDIDQNSEVESDFLLVCGDVIANISLEQALEEHRERRTADKTKPIMTLLLRQCAANHLTRTAEDDMMIVLDSNTQQVLHYKKITPETTKVPLPLKSFIQNDFAKFDIRYDLADVGIAICSPQVSQLFTDNFDYQTREDFIKGILINEEFLGNQIHAHITKKGNAFRISSMHMYDTISKAVICRWIYPYVPDNDFERCVRPWSNRDKEGGDVQPYHIYQHMRRNVYVGNIKAIGKESGIEKNSVIGHGVTIGQNCKITDSVIGEGCKIGDGVTLKNAYLWSGVVVMDGGNIEKSILNDGVTVHENTKVKSGCILGRKVEVGPNTEISERTVIHLEANEDIFAEGGVTKTSMFGAKGRGVLWSSSGVEESSDEEIEQAMTGIWGMSLSERDVDRFDYEESDTSEDDFSENEEESDEYDEEERKVQLFSKEVEDSISRGIEENITADNLILEINSSKYAHNVSIQDLVSTVTRVTFEIANVTANGTAYFASLKKILMYLRPVFVNYNKSGQSQIDCLREIERYCLQNKHAFDCLVKVLLLLYENDVIAEEVIAHWHSRPPTTQDIQYTDLTPEKLRSSVQKFMDWLQEAEEESDED